MQSWHDLWNHPWTHSVAAAVALLLIALLAGALARFALLPVVRAITRRTTWRWDDALLEQGTFKWLARMLPTMVIQFGIALVPGLPTTLQVMIANVAQALMIVFVALAASSALSALESLYRQAPHGNQRSIKALVQLVKIALFIAVTLVIIVGFTGRSVGWMLSGLGAMSAVLMLIFKDTILGFVAGVQLSSNDMLRVGDWITMPSAGADGDVIDISLHTVKVRNFDQTIVTVPTWKLISESYQNWRGMTEAGGRRIKRALNIDAGTVHFLNEQELAHLQRFRLLRDYLAGKHAELGAWNQTQGADAEHPFNRRRMTNLGCFRAYVQAYLDSHPDVHHGMSCMVRQLQSGPEGVPLELYCFTATTQWAAYERIQSDIFDHLIALLPEFGLQLYQQPSGGDVRSALAPLSRVVAQSPASPQEQATWRAST
ncbi:mechanosensitive ion channel family protein [Dyella sp. C9]|uniref:mechanosensitive ion channel family protein n=1 Tax=Dyella sp. C9 TaxID=2202154 RepID=UPI000DEEAD9D|nr:mechanosensitive ion channel domain-containing protein [Dyella sp. C9]